MKRFLMSLIVTLVLLSAIPAFQQVSAQETDVKVFITGPEALGLNAKAVYSVTVVGGPAEEGGNWTVTAYLTGANITGAIPIEAGEFNQTQEDNVFQIDVTATPIEQHMTLVVNAYSQLGNRSAHTKEFYDIYVVRPISLRATVSNPSNSTLMDVLVSFHVDEELIGSSTIGEIGPYSEGSAAFSWITKGISPGQHKIRIEIDLDGDGIVDETKGEILTIRDFYGPKEPNLIFIIIIIALVVVIIILLPSTLRKKKRRK
jgi:hypothetical protein